MHCCPDLAEVASALDYMLAQQEPYPAVVVDRHWNLLKSNAGAVRLVEFLVGPIRARDTHQLGRGLGLHQTYCGRT